MKQPGFRLCNLVLLTSSLLCLQGVGSQRTVALDIQPDQESAVHFYGDTPQANQMGHGYLIYQQTGRQVVGAFYYPRSEYQCFIGQSRDQNLDVVAMDTEQPESLTIPLTGLHVISQIQETARQVLAACHLEAQQVAQSRDRQAETDHGQIQSQSTAINVIAPSSLQ